MALSKNFTVADVYSRAEHLCNEVEMNRVAPASLVAMLKRKILSVVTFAGGALNEFYTAESEFDLTAVSGSAGIYVADISSLNFFKIQSVTVPASTFNMLASSDDGSYAEVRSKEAWQRLRRNTEDARHGRHYFLELGNTDKELYVHIGTQISAGKARIAVLYKRTPDISFTIDDCRDPATSVYVDVPDFYVHHVEYSAAVDALKQAGAKQSDAMQRLTDDHKEVLAALNQMYQAEDANMRKKGEDK